MLCHPFIPPTESASTNNINPAVCSYIAFKELGLFVFVIAGVFCFWLGFALLVSKLYKSDLKIQ